MGLIERHASSDDQQNVYRHYSQSLKCEMNAGVYLPLKAENERSPMLYWFSGLTCNEQNFTAKSGMQRYAVEHNITVVVSGTNLRGSHAADANRYDFGQGAGFYLNATQAPWNEYYKMYDYIRNELPNLMIHHLPATARKSVSGHSMSGSGTLVLALRDPGEYVSVPAFSSIVSLSQVPWEQQAFVAYLGKDKGAWLDYDPVSIISQGQRVAEIIVDQGLSDDFYAEQLRTPNPEKICQEMDIKTLIHYHEGYDHSYYFVSSSIGEHIVYNTNKLNTRW